jgi:hypothetical protein
VVIRLPGVIDKDDFTALDLQISDRESNGLRFFLPSLRIDADRLCDVVSFRIEPLDDEARLLNKNAMEIDVTG